MADLIDRQAAINTAIEAADRWDGGYSPEREGIIRKFFDKVPAIQPDRDVVDDCLHHIYKNISVHTATGGVIAIRYYMEKLYEEIYGEGERPWWMT